MGKDIVIFDDDRNYTVLLSEESEELGLHPIVFTNASEALEHLTQRQEAPQGYLIDMKPCKEPAEGFQEAPDKFPELAIPEKIFDYANSRGWTNHFYFMSSHLSSHDEDVLARTRAQFILKGMKSIKPKLEMIAKESK
ncbi:MAG: hypothetical protein WC533_02320 [Candidatus Pacearchaeota archaeon]